MSDKLPDDDVNDLADALRESLNIRARRSTPAPAPIDAPRKHQHPNQPLAIDEVGTVRFRTNKIVRYLLDAGPFDMNHLAALGDLFSADDRCQFAQLIGYSVSGFGDLPYTDAACVDAADEAARYFTDEKKES